MIKSLLNFRTQNIPSQQKFIKIAFNQGLNSFKGAGCRKTAPLTSLVILLGCWLGSGLGCSGSNIHPDLTTDSHILVRKWTFPTHSGVFEAGDHGTEFSNPVGTGDTLVFGNRSVGLISLYPMLNQVRWTFPVRDGVVSELAIDRNTGVVYFGGGDGHLYAVNLDNGEKIWDYNVSNPYISRPTLSGGRVFITTSDDMVYAFDAATGKWLWHFRRRSGQVATILGASAPLVDGNEVITGLSDGFLVALSLEEGQLKWERKLHTGVKFTDVDAHPILENGIIYIPSYDGALYALKRQGGDVIWRFDAGGSKNVVIDDQHIYLPSSDGNIYALQKNSAKVLWKFELDGGTPTQMAATDKYLIFGSSFQYFYVVDKNSGKGLYRFNVGYGSGFYGSPFFDSATQRIYTLSDSGNLYSFLLRSPPKKIRSHGAIDPYDFY